VIFLTLEDVCKINREWILLYGGRYVAENNNFCNTSSLEYILDIIQHPIYGIDKYPSLIEKASALAWWIIEGHIFNDGNKRTGMQAAIELLEMNGFKTHFDADSVVEIAVQIASGKISVDELTIKFSKFVEMPPATSGF
jgi:death on curing protein